MPASLGTFPAACPQHVSLANLLRKLPSCWPAAFRAMSRLPACLGSFQLLSLPDRCRAAAGTKRRAARTRLRTACKNNAWHARKWTNPKHRSGMLAVVPSQALQQRKFNVFEQFFNLQKPVCIWVVFATLSLHRNWKLFQTSNFFSKKLEDARKDRIYFPFVEHRRQNQSVVIRVDTDRSQNTLESKQGCKHTLAQCENFASGPTKT